MVYVLDHDPFGLCQMFSSRLLVLLPLKFLQGFDDSLGLSLMDQRDLRQAGESGVRKVISGQANRRKFG